MMRRRLWMALGVGALLAGAGVLWAKFGAQVFLSAFGTLVC